MKRSFQAVLAAAALVAAGHAAAQITFYEGEGFRGRAFTTANSLGNFERSGFNDRASSAVVEGGRWEVCEHARYEGRCYVLRPGSYPSLRQLGLGNAVSSARPVDPRRRYSNEVAVPLATPNYEYRVRPNEQIFDVPVTSVRAVVGPPNQQCWVERQQVAEPARTDPNIGGAVIGGIVGGILGHQIGGGSGKDLATAGGVVAGAVVGSNIANNTTGPTVVARDVQRCQTVANTAPAYWDVTYNFRGMEHRVQMSAPPGPSLRVNGNGEPRQ
jgi:uncharacterized protein YcfJ